MKADTQKNVRTLAGIAAWAVMLALSQESAALDSPQREDFARYSEWRTHPMATAWCGESLMPMLASSEPALICSDALHLLRDRNEADGKTRVTDTFLLRGATYTVHSSTIVALFQ
jgi:hypothetical protein